MNAFDSSDEEDCEQVVVNHPRDPLHIDWLPIPSKLHYPGALAISSIPGCRFRSVWRNLREDIDEICRCGIQEVFVFCTLKELSMYRVPALLSAYENSGLTVHHWPIEDGRFPAMDELLHLLQDVQLTMQSGAKILMHCYGGLGRACLVAACLLLQLDDRLSSEMAIDMVRQLRGPGAVQTVKQYNFLLDFRQLRDEYMQNGLIHDARPLSR